jgi:hypothetical protein
MGTKLSLPIRGINKGIPHAEIYQQYSPKMNNVRATDVLAGRLRLGQRPGLSKWGAPTQVGAIEVPVVAMCTVSSVE